MRPFATLLLPMFLALASCTSTDYDLLETASITPRFHDKDPQDFGPKTPQHHPVHGIDVSKWNGDIDWQTVRKSGVSFAFIKSTEGKDNLDNKFQENWRNAAAAGVPYAPYHFYYFCSTADEQADWFIRNVPKKSIYLPPVLDVEWNGESKTCRYRPSKVTAVAELQRFMDRIESHYGKRPIIYTSVDFHRDILVGEFKNYHFWLRSVANHPTNVYEDRRWAFWQYTSTGVIPGIKGDTDINVFAGSHKNWRNWVTAVSEN
ncbi:glycoside hydrolase family 25 protein [Rhizobium sp. KVB221]|uniref:Glycoside hydrolase family 25 protein n=1 Tax=Rhizobium setariae TaxID=2801340 RepID=A0A937CMM5_9HYPH|nr:GH25 family lysozyme [Rhizobium setariae]MBL0374495.1 glycoside hydrolase family 25 protein [Rhizobium setariae]